MDFTSNEWKSQSQCRQPGVDPELFFPPSYMTAEQRHEQLMLARRVCARCDVFERCRQYAIARKEKHGIWAGVNVAGRGGKDRLAHATRPGILESRLTRHRRRAMGLGTPLSRKKQSA